MGFTYNGLIPVGILFMNPGITREEFVELLDQTHSAGLLGYEEDEAWDYYPEFQEPLHHGGLEGLAAILGLNSTKQYSKLMEGRYDENGIFINPPSYLPPNENRSEEPDKFLVHIHEKNIIGSPERRKELSWGKLKKGSVWKEIQCGLEHGLVEKIFWEEDFGAEDEDFLDGIDGPRYDYDMEIRIIETIYRKEAFETEEEMLEAFPQFGPDYIYDWSQEKGKFLLTYFNPNFFWINRDGKYYLDETSFAMIPVGLSEGSEFELGYTDFILTLEALKHNAWKLLSYRGTKWLPDFLKDFPDSKAAHEKAIWDAYTSFYARDQRMSTSDFLRFRLLGARKVD